jgi:hypothetical protein
MSHLYLTCGLCGRKQADGLLSRGAWGHLETGTNGMLRACPTCKTANGDWQTQLLSVATLTSPPGFEQSA